MNKLVEATGGWNWGVWAVTDDRVIAKAGCWHFVFGTQDFGSLARCRLPASHARRIARHWLKHVNFAELSNVRKVRSAPGPNWMQFVQFISCVLWRRIISVLLQSWRKLLAWIIWIYIRFLFGNGWLLIILWVSYMFNYGIQPTRRATKNNDYNNN